MLSPLGSPSLLMVLGKAEDGRRSVSDQLLLWRHCREHNANTLVIDAQADYGLTQHHSCVAKEPAMTLHSVAMQAAQNPEGNSQWLDCLLADLPSCKEMPPFDWLCLGSQWQEPEAKVAERLAFSLRRFVKKTYELVLVDGYSPFLLKAFAGLPVQLLLVASTGALPVPPELESPCLQAEGLLPMGLILTQKTATESFLPESARGWLKDNERCLLLGKLLGLEPGQPLNEVQETRLQTCLLRLQLAPLF